MRFAFLLLFLSLLAGCRSGDDVTSDEDGTLQLGREEARAMTERAVQLGDRTLVLDSEKGSITIVGTDTDEVRLRIERIARGATLASAQSRLERLTIEEAGDDEIYQYAFRCNGVEGARVEVVAEVPRDARLNLALERGTIRLSGAAGDVTVENELGSVEAAGLAGRTVSIKTELGDVQAAFAALPAEAEVQIETQNGNVALTLPGDAGVRVDVQTQTGTISTEGLTFTKRFLSPAGTRFSGRLGPGQNEANIDVTTGVGSISLHEGRILTLDDLPSSVPTDDTTAVPPGAPVTPTPPAE